MLRATRLPLLLLPVAAFLVVLPLLMHGISCGQDMAFHLQSWLDAAHQFGQGNYPRWAVTPAWNAGEPRFLFYPPVSWLLGSALTAVLPITSAPIAYIFIALVASGFAMYYLARQYSAPAAALIAAVFYLANPYILFCAYERTAFAELLAAAWVPLLFAGIFKPRPTVRAIAIPLGLLWLTNAPAAVMASYTFALLATTRVAMSLLRGYTRQELSTQAELTIPASSASHSTVRLALTYIYATVLGLALPAFYLVPAAYERRFVQVDMAIIPNMRVQDNYLFTATADAAHNAVNHSASVLALTILALTIATLIALFTFAPSPVVDEAQHLTDEQISSNATARTLATALSIITILIALLLTPASSLLWVSLPNMQYLQFPWRLLTILSAVLAFALALLIRQASALDAPSITRLHRGVGSIVLSIAALALPLILTLTGYRLYAQACDTASLPTSIANLFITHHGAPPTDEYTPTDADNDLLRSNNPGYWLAPSLNAPAPHTTPTASELNPSLATDDTPIPDAQTLSTPASHHFTIHTDHPGILVLNLRDYPMWRITVQGYFDRAPFVPKRLQRDDGLLAIPLAADASVIHISWRCTRDQIAGFALSAIALMLLLWSPEPNG